MLTGYFNYLQYNKSWQKKCIAITYNKPVNVELQVYKPLSPGKFLFKYKNKNSQYGESEYMQDYWAQIKNLDPEKVLEELTELAGQEEPIIMCYCGRDNFCHRHLVARWLEKSGVTSTVFELGTRRYIRKNGYLSQKKG